MHLFQSYSKVNMKTIITLFLIFTINYALADIQKIQLKRCDPSLFTYLLEATIVPIEPTLLIKSSYGVGNFGGGNYNNSSNFGGGNYQNITPRR